MEKMYLSEKIETYTFFKTISKVANENNIKIYAVGGFVRDLLLGIDCKDIDFLVVGKGVDFAELLAKKMNIKNVTVFKNFGTAHFKYQDYELEFVGARRESYDKESRNPIVEEGSFEDDIARRDFTVNTLAISLNKENYGEFIDSFGGIEDLNNKLLKTPLDPQVTFEDDPLRIMRAIRFSAKLGFTCHHEVLEAIEEKRERLRIISVERITDEFLKILQAPVPSIGLYLLYKTKIFEIIFPEIANLAGVEQRQDYHHKDVLRHTFLVVDNIAKVTNNVWLRFAALVHDIAKPPTKRFVEGTGWTFHGHEELGARMMKGIFKRLKLPFSVLPYVEKLVRLHLRPIALVNESVTDSAIRRLIVSAGDDLDDLITLCRADITSHNPNKVKQFLNNYEIVMKKVYEVEEKDKLRAFQSPVRGEEIMKICNIPPSRKVGEIKHAIEEAILEGEIDNTYEAAYAYLLKMIEDKKI